MKHLKLFFALFAMLALGVGNAWSAEAEVYSADFTSVATHSYTQNKTFTLNSKSWTSSVSQVNGAVFYLGCNSNNKAKGVLNDNSTFSEVVTILKSVDSKYSSSVTTAHAYAMLFDNAYENVTKVSFGWAGGNNAFQVYLFGYNNSSWSLLKQTNYATSGQSVAGSVEWTGEATDYTKFAIVARPGTATSVASNKTLRASTFKIYATEDAGGSEEPVLSSIEISGELTNKTYEEGEELDFSGLTVQANYENGDPKDVTNDVEWSYTPNPLTKGTNSVNVTATYTENSVDKTVTKTITGLIVNEHVVTPGTYGLLLNNVFFGTIAGTNVSSFPTSAKQDDITVTLNGSGNKTRTDAANVRMYSGNTLTFAVPDGYVIKSIVFTEPNSSKQWDGSITVNTGTYTDGTKTWTGSAQEVTYTFGAQNRIATASVTYAADVKYALNITTPSNGTLVVKEDETEVTSGATFSEGTKLSVVADPAQGYKLDGVTVVNESSNDVTTDVYADGVLTMPAYNITISAAFSVNEKPAATLTLSKNGVEETFPGSWKQDDVVTLPSITSDCVKEFVGWSADANCATEPEYKAGDEYTLASPTLTQKLYAVYATVGGGGESTASVDMATYATANNWGSTSSTNQKQITINSDVKAVISEGGNSGKYYNDGVRIYQSESATVTISTTVGELKSVKFTFTSSSDGTLLYGSTKLTSGTAIEVSGTSAVFSVSDTHATENKGQIRFTAIEVVYTGGVSYSNYSTTCAAALANPTFSLTEGKYTEAKSVTISATEGTIYYTLDGTDPTVSSTQYNGPIALNDCGEYTIKAIAISSDSQSDVVSATYTIKLPLTNSQAAPYTEAEAIAVYDGGCYDNQDVYVKGTVKTATFNSTYGNYTITLTNGFQFYRFLQAAETKFTEDIIVPGDVLVACGKLIKYQTTYQLAEGCYLVERIPYEGEKTDISNTEATAYTVDKAFELIADVKSDLTKEVYVKGLVAVAPTSNPTADGQMTYKISDNGENTGNVLTVYLGLNLNGEKFTSKNDVQQGDYVVVKGKLLDYNSTYELNKGNQLVQHVKAATITIADITMEVGETKTIAATITPDAAKTEVTYSIKAGSDDCITLSENNITAKAEGTATIVATIATAEGEYMGKTVEFKVTVTPVNIATLPFAFDGGVNDIKNTLGMSQKNLGSDYTSADSPKLKFDDTDDNVIIHFDSEPVELSFTLKQNGDNGATYTVYESEDGNTFSPVWVAGEIGYGKTQDVTVSLSDAARYVKFEYTNKIPGTNYALGKISITNTYSTPTTLSGKFSTGKYEYAEFATGNLQYKKEGENETWRFAKQQYQYVGEANINVGDENYEGWIDMFGWSTDDAGNNYGVNPNNVNDLYDGTFQDWGTKMGEGWSTLSADQWKYLLNTRPNASSLKQIARVGSVVGIMLFPDDWTMPSGIDVTAQDDDYFEVKIYNYSLDQWVQLENDGALFLPAAGRRTGGHGNMINYDQVVETDQANLNGGHYKHQDNTNIYCYYWTSTINETTKNVSYLHNIQALGGNKYTIGTGAVWGEKGRYGQSVRLAKVTSTLVKIGDSGNTSVIEANNGKEVDVQVNRTFTADKLHTLCLPFDAPVNILGEGTKAYQLSGVRSLKDGTLTIDVTTCNTMYAGAPYLVIPAQNFADGELIVDNVTMENVDVTTVNNVVSNGEINVVFQGILDADGNQTNGTTHYYIGQDSYLYNGQVDILGLRSMFTITGLPAGMRARVAFGENSATGFDNITSGENTVIKVFENGQLIIIRDGEKFNAQGQRL